MKIAHIYPNDDKLMPLWLPYSKHSYLDQNCDKGCDIIYCASVTQIGRAVHYAVEFGKQIVCWVWDLPFNWREWCRNDQDYAENKWRDSDISFKLDCLKRCELVLGASNATSAGLATHGIESGRLYHFVGVEDINRLIGTVKVNRICQVSRFAINKRFHWTLDMFKEIQKEHPDWELLMIGPERTPYCVEIENRIKDEGIKNAVVKINPSRYETLHDISASKILVSPSLHEGWGLTPIEGAILGTVPVMADIEVVEEYWGLNDTVFRFIKDDQTDFLDSVEIAIGEWKKGTPKVEIDTTEITPKSFAERFDNYLERNL